MLVVVVVIVVVIVVVMVVVLVVFAVIGLWLLYASSLLTLDLKVFQNKMKNRYK